jgi:membrane protease YdiL (CAAX protease family)
MNKVVISNSKNSTTMSLRNLAIFAVVVLASGWLGYGLDRVMNNPPTQSLGMLLWLIAPLVTVLLLRAFAGDGWQDFGLRPAFRGNGVWYAVSLLLYPLVAGFVLIIGGVLGFVTFPDFSWRVLLSVFALGLAPAFIKNIFEEFAWRGYLAPKINSLPLNAYVGHVLVGLIWGGWHIPYWLFYVGNAQIQAASAQGLASFVPAAILGLIPASVAYNELRLLTNSVWPALLMHTVGNALIDGLVAQGLINIATGMGFLVAPTHQSLLTMVFFLLAGIWLHQQRVSQQLVD